MDKNYTQSEIEKELLKEFKFIYSDEKIKKYAYIPFLQIMVISCYSGYDYKLKYENGNISTQCMNY